MCAGVGETNLDLTTGRIEKLELTDLVSPTKFTCDNHEGTTPAALIQ